MSPPGAAARGHGGDREVAQPQGQPRVAMGPASSRLSIRDQRLIYCDGVKIYISTFNHNSL